MKRRSFVKGSSLLVAPSLIGGIPMTAVAKSSLTPFIDNDSDRVLVLIQLNGGNDGLATIIPKDQQDNLAAVRPNIFIPENTFLDVTDDIAFHPTMEGMKNVFDNGEMNIVQSVGYPDQNRSHFRSIDIWHTGSNANEFLATGWLGRYLDSRYPGFPDAYPNNEHSHPFAMTIGSSVTETCQGEGGNFSLAVVDPNNLNQLASPTNNELIDGCASEQLSFLVRTIEQTNVYSDVISDAYSNGNSLSTKYDDDNPLATKLKTVARLISGGLQSKIYVVSLGGFDTHANQVVEGETTTGEHAVLLKTLSDAIDAFQDDIKLLQLEKRVLGMTYSEFGRRIRSNYSQGTDHGSAAPLVVFGSCVNAGIIGENPTISPDASVQEGVAMQFDFRSVYGSLLMDWFDLQESDVRQIFDFDFQYLPIANQCGSVSLEDIEGHQFQLKIFPNPVSSRFTLSFENKSDWVKISVFDVLGSEIKVLVNKTLDIGHHELSFDLDGFPDGPYFVRIQSSISQKTIRLIKQ